MLFLGTASGDSSEYLLTFYQEFAGVDCEPSHLALFDRVVDDIDALVRSQDVGRSRSVNCPDRLGVPVPGWTVP